MKNETEKNNAAFEKALEDLAKLRSNTNKQLMATKCETDRLLAYDRLFLLTASNLYALLMSFTVMTELRDQSPKKGKES